MFYPRADNIIYSPMLPKTASLRLFGHLVRRREIFQDRVFNAPGRTSQSDHPGPTRAQVLAADEAELDRLCPTFMVRLAERKGSPVGFFLRMSKLDDLQLLVLANLCHSDYCIVPTLGTITALECFQRFMNLVPDLARLSSHHDLHCVFPTVWDAVRKDEAAVMLCRGLAAFVYHPVILPGAPLPVPLCEALSTSSRVPTLVLPTWLTAFAAEKMPWLRSICATPAHCVASRYVHLGESGCATMEELKEMCQPRRCDVTACVPASIQPWSAGGLPFMEWTAIEDYVRRMGGALEMGAALDAMQRGMQRLDCPSDQSLAPMIGTAARDPNIRIIYSNIALSLNKTGHAKAAVSLRCGPRPGGEHGLYVEEVLEAQCTCTIKDTKTCNHVVALLMLLQLNRQRLSAPVTGALATWRQPAGAAKPKCYSDILPVEDCLVTKVRVADVMADDPAAMVDERMRKRDERMERRLTKMKRRLGVLSAPDPDVVRNIMAELDKGVAATRECKQRKKAKH